MNPITNIPDTCIVLDTESTGFEPGEGHRMVEVGALVMRDGLPTQETFHSLIDPERIVPQAAVEVHGLDNAKLQGAPLFAHIAQDLLDFIGDRQVVAHNAGFDQKFLNFELERAGKPIIPTARWIDSVAIARRLFPGSPANLDALCRRFSISLKTRSKHGALIDTELLAEVLVEMGGGRQQSLLGFITPTKTQETTEKHLVRAETVKSVIDQSVIDAHKAFVFEKLGPTSLWAKYYENQS